MRRIEDQTSFRRLGTRSYVHSTQIFGEFLRLAGRLGPEARPLNGARIFKFIRETSRNGRCVIASPSEIDAKAAASTLAFESRSGEMLFCYFDDGGEAPDGGPDLAPAIVQVDATGDFGGRVGVQGAGAAQQLFVDLVEANKALHNATLLRSPGDMPPAYRFVYAENLPLVSCLKSHTTLIFAPRDKRQRGGHTYTLNEVRIESRPDAPPMRICFAF